jgi:TolA-binding protein
VKALERAAWSEYWPAYLRGQAHLGLRQGADAAAEFQAIIDRRGELPASQLYPLAHLGLARAAVLTGDTMKARDAYDKVLAVWHDADAALPAVREARQELVTLRPAGR